MAASRFAAILLFAFSCSPPGSQNTEPEPQQQETADQVFDGFEMTITDNGIKKGLVQADRAEKYEQRKIFRATTLTVVFYTSSGEVKTVMTSRRGLIHTDTGDMEAMDSVVVFSSDSTRTLSTEHLVWKKEDNLIVGDTAVVIRSPRGVVYGDGFVTDAGFENLEVKNPTGDINVLGDKF
ncbi:MAG TPA: LPS export ABC transporter periplasmic protein LptC [Candidatus Glassbacteria bacterium]|nr:LPS export ABC transporter periplasmic protein LptC [Candidatus Glassbacteria bacterium]